MESPWKMYAIHVKEHFRIVECLLILPHFFSSEPVLRVQALFLLQNSGILLRQFLDLWQLGYAHFLEGILCRFMEGDFLPVGFKERFAVASLSVLDIDLAGFGIVDDVLLQSGDFYQPLFGGFQLFVNSVEVCGSGACFLTQLIHGVNAMLFEKDSGLRHLLKIVIGCPPLISGAFCPNFIINDKQKIECPFLFCQGRFDSGTMLFLTRNDSLNIFFGIPFAQRMEPNKTLLVFSFDRSILIKMVLIQHLFGIPSLRQTYREIQVNVAYRWFLGYGLSVMDFFLPKQPMSGNSCSRSCWKWANIDPSK